LILTTREDRFGLNAMEVAREMATAKPTLGLSQSHNLA
jgi:hypothetical protein